MARMQSCSDTFGKMVSPKTSNCPGSADTPLEIDPSAVGDNIVGITLTFPDLDAIVVAIAEDSTEGGTNIASDNTRVRLIGGTANLPCVGMTDKFYIRRDSGAAVSRGISYWFIEGTRD